MATEVRVPEARDRTSRGIARRARDFFRKTSGRPSSPDDDETVLSVPRRAGESAARPRPISLDLDEEE